MIALYPVLQFAGGIAGVSALLEHGYDHNLYRNRAWLRGRPFGKGRQEKQGNENARADRH
jgi:hypothetical protein